MTFRLIGVMLVACLVATSAQAQRTGSRLGKNADSADSEAVLENMARCVGQRKPGYAVKILDLMPGSQVEHKMIFGNRGDLGLCMEDQTGRLVIPDNVKLTMTARSFRIRLVQTMAKEVLAGMDASMLNTARPWSSAIYEGDQGSNGEADKFQLALYQFGDCVVAAKPIESAVLVSSTAKSPESNAALKALLPVLSPCLQEGVELELTQDLLVVALAEPIYQRGHALKLDGSGKGRP